MSKIDCDSLTPFDKLLFGVRRSIRYHTRLRSHFDTLHKYATILSALSGTAVIATVLAKSSSWWSLLFAAAVTFFSMLDLIIDAPKAARLHHDFARRFIFIEREMILLSDPTDADWARFTAARLDIEADEPPPLKTIDILCNNELLRALGYGEDYHTHLSWYQRLFCCLF